MKIDASAAHPDHTLIPVILKAQFITTHTEATLDHTIGSTKDTTGVAPDTHTPTLTTIDPAMTHNIADHLHMKALLLTPEIATGHTLDQPTHPLEEFHTDLPHAPANHDAKHIPLATPE